jgi:hypothetical protein
MRVLLFASGVGDRWKSPIPKQLAPIAGVPVIERTLRQLGCRNKDRVVITHDPAIRDAVHGDVFYSPPSTKWPNTFLDVLSLLDDDRTFLFHGDVIWDDKALDIVLDSGGFHFFGTRKGRWENFAIGLDMEDYDDLIDAATMVLELRPGEMRCGTWEVYRSLVGIPLGQVHTFENVVWKEVKESATSDYTCDLDKIWHYRVFLEQNPWARDGSLEQTAILEREGR